MNPPIPSLPQIAAQGAADLGTDPALTLIYLRDRLSFALGSDERAAIERFRAGWQGLRERS